MSNIKDVQDVILYESGLEYYTNSARDNCSIRQLLCLRPCTDSFCPTELKDASVQSEPEEKGIKRLTIGGMSSRISVLQVLVDGQPAPHLYRWCRISDDHVHPGHSDDYAALAEVIPRLFSAYVSYVYVYVCAYMCILTPRVHTHTHTHTHACMHACMHECVCLCAGVRTIVCLSVSVFVCVCVCVCIMIKCIMIK